MIKRALTLDNALNITPRISINDAAGPEVGCTTGRARTPAQDEGEVADAHLKRQVMGREVLVAVTNGLLCFGA